MKKAKELAADVGVIVARVQVHELHEAHLDLFQTVCNEHSKVIVFLGLSPLMVTQNNPLDFESRKQMILEKFPNVIVMYIKDNPSDQLWSIELDEKIKDLTGPGQSVVLYGSRDSFISHYSGKYKTQELVQEIYVSGSETRKAISKKVKNTSEFRAGVIWAAYNQYPKCYPTVDIAIFSEGNEKLLLARKAKEDKYRFVGGFGDPLSPTYEEDACREVMEETGLEVGKPEYLGSFTIDDWRYRHEKDKIKTLFFKANVIYGRPQANDDICEVRWFDYSEKIRPFIMDAHLPLFDCLINKVSRKTLLK